jgi:integrase
MQKGSIVRVGNCWMLRYYEPVIENGRTVKKQKTKKLNPKSNREDDVRAAADLILAPINAQTTAPESRLELGTFLEHVFLPYVKEKKRPSTYMSYRQCWYLIQPHTNGLELREIRTSEIDELLLAATGDKQRAHTTHRNLKNFLSSAFRVGIRKNFITSNPVRDAEIPRGLPAGPKHNYSLEEIQKMMAVLPEPGRTIVIVAAFTGLRKQEIKGLRWEDFKGNELHVQRSVYGRHVQETKTLASKAPVPVLPIVRTALEEHRKRTPDMGFIFTGMTSHKPLRIENLFRRDLRPVLVKNKIPWKGWHAFRRGLGTNLNTLGVDPKTIQAILRHSELSTTMEIYVQPVPKESHAAMKKLERAFKAAKAKRGAGSA